MKNIALVLLLVVLGLEVWYWNYLRIAHNSFDNYYAFRGCQQLVSRTETGGICKTSSGQTIKIVEYQGQWYLDGDLPYGCIGKFCVGL